MNKNDDQHDQSHTDSHEESENETADIKKETHFIFCKCFDDMLKEKSPEENEEYSDTIKPSGSDQRRKKLKCNRRSSSERKQHELENTIQSTVAKILLHHLWNENRILIHCYGGKKEKLFILIASYLNELGNISLLHLQVYLARECLAKLISSCSFNII